uniref:EGF_CA domain-containing protein n=1 Tax=Heterorhabditis bacteriophora TaxID=37862 RepID=A0A1I7WTX8_HETBA
MLVWFIALTISFVIAQEDSAAQPVCSVNQLFNGQICTCAPGGFYHNSQASPLLIVLI